MVAGVAPRDISRPSTARENIATTEATPELKRRQDSYGRRDPAEYFLNSMETVMAGLEARMADGHLPQG